jgi:DNA-binding NtrC family response regulator
MHTISSWLFPGFRIGFVKRLISLHLWRMAPSLHCMQPMRQAFHTFCVASPQDSSVLIVDHDVSFGNRLAAYFKRRDLYARSVNSLPVARHLITAMRPAVAIVEYCGAAKEVESLCAFMRRFNFPTEIILTSGRRYKDAEQNARRLGPAFFFFKPFNEDDLFAVVLRIIETQSRKYGAHTCIFQGRRAGMLSRSL